MTFHKILAFIVSLNVALLPHLAMAQSSDFDRAFQDRGAEARLSLRIPLGEGVNKTKTTPRLELGVRHYTDTNAVSTNWMLADQPNYQDARLSLTLESNPQFMLNDQVLVLNQAEEENLGTGGKIGLGVAAVVLVLVAVVGVVIATADFSDDE